MPTNDFLPFATAVGANVLDQVDYAALAAVSTGFTAGTAQSEQLNKVWRQASIIAKVLTQFIVDQTGQNAVDDGTTATLEANLVAAILKSSTGRLLNVQIFTASGTYTNTAGTTSVVVEVQGGGGAGAGANAASAGQGSTGGGGCGGGYAKSRLTTGFTGGVAITVGAGGVGGSGAGATGGTSSFGAILSATGGSGSSVGGSASLPAVATSTGIPGVGSGGNILNLPGSYADQGVVANVGDAFGCRGGDAFLGSGGGYVFLTGAGPSAVAGYGGGGSGGLSLDGHGAANGGSGRQGVVIIYEFA